MTNLIPIGKKVKIRKNSEYYGISVSNPAEMVGTIIKYNNEDIYNKHYIYKVKWDNKYTNNYKSSDLELWEIENIEDD